MKIVVITGVSSGIGFGLTKKFLAENYRVIGTVRASSKATELQKVFGENFSPLICDICIPDEIDKAAESLHKLIQGNTIHGLINNAGTAEIGPLLHIPIKDFQKHMDVLVTGQLYVIQRFYKFLTSKNPNIENGRIINITSVSGKSSNYLFGSYVAGKHAFEGLSKTLREELKLSGIKVIVIAPGNIATSIWDKQTFNLIEKYKGTDYYGSLQGKINWIISNVKDNAITVDEFSDAFFKIYEKKNPAHRYTIIKSRFLKFPFSKNKLWVFKR
jgi:short-subunit dehydrogenase